MAKADIVVGNSPHLISLAQHYNPSSEFIGQGCDVKDYLPNNYEEEVDEFKCMKGPKIGYVGLLTTRRLDAQLIYNLALEKKDWNFILIGPQEACFENHELHKLRNVHFLGNKKTSEIPRYVKQLDVCINPQVLNELTKSNYPRKIDEYLASGKPVVATETPTMKIFEQVVALCKTKEGFIQKIHEALTEEQQPEKKQKRINVALEHSWENCVQAFWKAVNQHSKTFSL
jgi:glycosyltransferase involved in cell wall biosynthesis